MNKNTDPLSGGDVTSSSATPGDDVMDAAGDVKDAVSDVMNGDVKAAAEQVVNGVLEVATEAAGTETEIHHDTLVKLKDKIARGKHWLDDYRRNRL